MCVCRLQQSSIHGGRRIQESRHKPSRFESTKHKRASRYTKADCCLHPNGCLLPQRREKVCVSPSDDVSCKNIRRHVTLGVCLPQRPLTVVEVEGLFEDAGLRGGDPKVRAQVFQAETEQFLGPVSNLNENQQFRRQCVAYSTNGRTDQPWRQPLDA